MRIEGTWRTTASPPAVFAVLRDLEAWPRWWPAISAVELLDGHRDDDFRVARLTFDTPARLPALVVEVSVSERPPEELTLAPRAGPVAGSGRLEVTAEGAGSATRYLLVLRFRSLLLRPVERVLAGAARGSGRERLARAGDELASMAGGEPLEHDP